MVNGIRDTHNVGLSHNSNWVGRLFGGWLGGFRLTRNYFRFYNTGLKRIMYNETCLIRPLIKINKINTCTFNNFKNAQLGLS